MGEPLYRVAELRRLEQAAQAALPPGTLMQRAGAAAATVIARRLPEGRRRVCVVCGPGNNGGDGYVCALELARQGIDVLCVSLGSPGAEDARAAFFRWTEAGGTTVTELPADDRCDAVIDAMFGIGMARPLAGPYLAAAEWINRQRAQVLAIDLPSGLDADRGCWVGNVAGVRAAATVTFIGAKTGLFTGAGCDAAGTVDIEPIGVAPGQCDGKLLAADDFASVLAPRARNTHKGTYGSVAVVGGNVGMVGAPLLAARAALRLGAGRVYVDCIGAPELRLDPLQPELMFRPLAGLQGLTSCVVGCGLGEDAAARAALSAALASNCPVVIDADALNVLAAAAPLAIACRGRDAATVLTPHPLEAARLLGTDASSVQDDRVGHAIELARRFTALVVLKGAGSVIAGADGRYAINPTGSPALATAGTGDVLAGMIGALLGQTDDPLQAVHAAVWLHGAAADAFGADIGLAATDLAPLAARQLAELRAGR
ncbi:MAG: NAD(P)H-hydrate dehydratase [Burkholderiales bacterium]|nr:MAG: NAD(P)H-hydrate dehydratase [Burkholderiales bacterium]